jgi:hypothetical protein
MGLLSTDRLIGRVEPIGSRSGLTLVLLLSFGSYISGLAKEPASSSSREAKGPQSPSFYIDSEDVWTN